MSRYDILEAGFSSLDETINFGARAVGDSSTSLYEIITLAVIRSSETDVVLNSESCSLKIISQYQHKKIFFSINRMLRIIKDKNMTEELGFFEFDYNIDTFCVSSCGKFILICTHNGMITIRDLSSSVNDDQEDINIEFPVVFEEKLEGVFKGSFHKNSSFYVVTSKGLIKKIQLDSDINLFNSEDIIDLRRDINICSFQYPYLCLEGNVLIMLNVLTKCFKTDNAIGLRNLHAVETYFFACDNIGNLYKIYWNELLIFCVNEICPYFNNYCFDGFMFFNDNKGKKFLVALKNQLGESEEAGIELMTYPESEVIYSIPVEKPIHLMSMYNESEDVLFFKEVHKNHILSEIRLQVIVKADPEFRVKKLIERQLFDEAEIFAKNFNISPEIIAQAKAQHIINKILCTTQDVDDLLSILDTIDDHLFKLNCCCSVDCELGTDTKRVLCYGAFMDINIKDCNENRDNVLLKMKTYFNDKLHRFDTFMELYEEYDHLKWNDFINRDLIDEMKMFLQKGDIEKASLILNRLDHDAVSELTTAKIEEIIFTLNKDMLNTTFLNTFICISLKYVPESLTNFVKWLHGRVFQLEKQSTDFPECAIKFVEDMSKVMDMTPSIRIHLYIENSNRLTCMLKALKDLKTLLKTFGIRISLSEYLYNPSNTVRTLLVTNTDLANFEALLIDFVCPFILNNNLDMDSLLIDELENLLIYEEEYWISTVPVLLRFITSTDKKLELAYKILERSHIPWSKNVKNIAEMICQLSPKNSLVEKVIEHMNKEHILIILRKYNIQKTQFEESGNKMFYINRIIYLDRPSLLEDINHLCLDDEVRQEVDLLLITKQILKGNFEKAMKILDEKDSDTVVTLCRNILNRCLFFATAYDLPKKYRDPYFTVLKLIWNRLMNHIKGSYEKESVEFDYKIAKGIYGISESFQVHVKCSDLTASRKRDQLLDTLIQKALDTLESDSDYEPFLHKCKKLAQFFDTALHTVFLKCLNKSENFNLFLKVGHCLLNTSTNSQILSSWALYLFKYTKNSLADEFEETLSDAFVTNAVSKHDEDYLVGIELAKKLSVKAMMHATTEDHLAVMEIIRWIDSCFYLNTYSVRLNLNTLQNFYCSNILNQGSQSVELVKSAFNMYCAAIESSFNPNKRYLRYFTTHLSINEDQFQSEMERFSWNINLLLKEGQYLTCFNVIKILQQGFLENTNKLKNANVMKLQTIIDSWWLPETLDAVLSHRYVDKALFLNLMLLCGKKYEKHLLNYLNVYKRQTLKLSVIAQVGLELCKHHDNVQGKHDLLDIFHMCKWWNKIANKDVTYESFFKAKCDERMEALIFAKKVNLDSLPEYCLDFGLDLQKSYLKYLEITLKSWQPTFKKITDNTGKNKVVVQNSESELNKECQNIIQRISNKDTVVLLVDQMWPSVNYYYYEIHMVLLSIHTMFASTKNTLFETYRTLLLFLKDYGRVSSPSRSEVEQWFGTFHQKAFIDPLSEFRLPVTSKFFSSDIWTIIKPEVNLDTYKDWVKVVPILKQFLNEDDICTYAINSAIPPGPVSTTWDLYGKYDHIIAKVEECAWHIRNLERATAAVYTLMSNITPGADKVKIAKLSYKYAQLYRDSSNSEKVEKVYTKVKQRYYNYSATHILHKYQLAEEEYLELVAQPIVLISKLYDDPRNQRRSVQFNCPDINTAVDEICLLFGLNPKKTKFHVLSELLKSKATLDFDKDAESDSLMRAYYICESTEDFSKYLLKIGMDLDNEENTISTRANALKCFYYTSDLASLEKMSEMTIEHFLDYLNKLLVMANLDDLGLKFKTVEDLDNFNKKKLLRKLSGIDRPIAIKCIGRICKIYGFDDLNYWEFIVNSAIRYNMIKDLRDYVEYLRFRCVKDFIKKAWNEIITDSFKTELDDIKTLLFLQTCPVIHDLNFDAYIEQCISLKKLDTAAVLMQYIPIEKCDPYLKVIKSTQGAIEDISRFKNRGILGINKILHILEF